MMRSFALSLMAVLLFSGGFVQADEMKNLKLRVEGHIKTMMDGERTPLLVVQDYYSTVYITSKATVQELTQKPNGDYQVTVLFETVSRIQQDAEKTPISKSEVKKKEDRQVQLSFRVGSKSLKWLDKLETPFVKVAHENRYMLRVPSSKNKVKTSPTKKTKPSSADGSH